MVLEQPGPGQLVQSGDAGGLSPAVGVDMDVPRRERQRRHRPGVDGVRERPGPDRVFGIVHTGGIHGVVDVGIPGELDPSDRARLQQVQRAVAEGPLDVLGHSFVIVLHPPAQIGQRRDLVIGERRNLLPLLGDGFGHGLAAGGVTDDLQGLRAGRVCQDPAISAADGVLVGGDDSLDDGLAEAPAGVDHDLVGSGGERVPGEHDPRYVGLHHRLDHDRDQRRRLVEPVVVPVGGRPGRPQGRPAPLDSIKHGVATLDVEEAVVQTGEGTLGKVFGRPRRSHRDIGLIAQVRIRRLDGRHDLIRDRGGHDAVPHTLQRRLQLSGVRPADARESKGDCLVEMVGREELHIGIGRESEAWWHIKSGLSEPRQVSPFAANATVVIGRFLDETENVSHTVEPFVARSFRWTAEACRQIWIPGSTVRQSFGHNRRELR